MMEDTDNVMKGIKMNKLYEKISVDFVVVRDDNGMLNIPRTKESFNNKFAILMETLNNYFISDDIIWKLLINLFSEEFCEKRSSNYLSKRYIVHSLINKIECPKDNFEQIALQIESFLDKHSRWSDDRHNGVVLMKSGNTFSLRN
jgi:hypothetical protein